MSVLFLLLLLVFVVTHLTLFGSILPERRYGQVFAKTVWVQNKMNLSICIFQNQKDLATEAPIHLGTQRKLSVWRCLDQSGPGVITVIILPLVYLIQKEIVANGWKVQHDSVYTYNMYIYIYSIHQCTYYDVKIMLAHPTYVDWRHIYMYIQR